MRKKISDLEVHVELHTFIAYLSLHSSLKRIMNTLSNVYSIIIHSVYVLILSYVC